MSFKPVAIAPSDGPLQVPFAIGFANLSQTLPFAARRLTRCYASLRQLVTLVLVVLAHAHVHAECNEQEMIQDAFSVIEKMHPNSAPALLRSDAGFSDSESIQRLASTLKNSSSPILVDDRNRNEYWLNKISKFRLYPEFVEPGSLAGAKLYVLASPEAEDEYLKVIEDSGLRIVFLQGKCA